MIDHDSELLYFRSARRISGRAETIDVTRRNGRLVPRFDYSWTVPDADPDPEYEATELVAEISQGLTAIERRTWLNILNGKSVAEIAAEEGVSRTAIYERIRGSSKGHGGMLTKNEYVAIWWQIRQHREERQ